jgi:two-component system, NtrC family, nitrogen regulation sensor histidine kinase NtrY
LGPAKNSSRHDAIISNRKRVIIPVALLLALVVGSLLALTSFDLPFQPNTNQQLLLFAALSVLIFVLFLLLTFVLARNLLKLFAERRLGVLGSKFRTRLVVVSLLLSFLPVIGMFLFAYVLMNRSIDRWFSSPVEEVRQDTALMTSLLMQYAEQNASVEAASIAGSAEMRSALASGNSSLAEAELRKHQSTLQGGFAVALIRGSEFASLNAPTGLSITKLNLPSQQEGLGQPRRFLWENRDYILGTAPVGENGLVLVATPLPGKFSETIAHVEARQRRYQELARDRRLVRRTYMEMLLLLTVVVLFAATWFALFLSKLVTRPVVALAEATHEISRGHLAHRVEVAAADEIGDLVHSFNRMASELESSRHQIEASSRELTAANIALDQRRKQIETILESIPNAVLSLNAERRVTHANRALLRLFHPAGNESGNPEVLVGTLLTDLFPPEFLADLEPQLRRADRMGTTTTPIEMVLPQRARLLVAVTVATLQHQGQKLGYVLVFEDLSELLKAQKQAAWREVARRVAHEIKNPLTPIGLSADRIRRHLQRENFPDEASYRVFQGCAETISRSVETVRGLVDEFATLARFPAPQPQSSDINSIVENTLSMFDGRLEGIYVRTNLADDLPQVMADPEAIKRALANLVDNAAEAMHEALFREICISTAMVASHDAVEIGVADTGHGVTQEIKERLFLPYFSTKKRGTGLGLAIVSRIVEDHHGTIRVEENRPVGARFVIELPVVADVVEATSGHSHA